VRLFRAEDKHGRTELAAFSNLFFIPRSGKHRKSLADVDRDVITMELVVVVFIFKAMYLKEKGTRNPRRTPLKSHQTIHDIRCTKSAMSFFSPLVAGKHGSYLRLGFRW
jgi:hypothetical protein